MNPFDAIVVGAGISGAVMAEQLASQLNMRVLVIEKREHVGGNCYDYQDEHDIFVHRYGPHLFHTDDERVWEYLSGFTDWTPYEHHVLASVDGELVPMPVNLNTLRQTYPKYTSDKIEKILIETYGHNATVPILELRKSVHGAVKEMAEFIYDSFFLNYTAKQWGCTPEEVSPLVTARVPVRISEDNRYFRDKYQAIPSKGYTLLIQNMLSHPNITVRLNTDGLSLLSMDTTSGNILYQDERFKGLLVYTGMIDQLFDTCKGEMPYRSLKLMFETLHLEQFQPSTVVNYPNDHDFTRITEFKHIIKSRSDKTTILREYPVEYDRNDPEKDIPYYTIFTDENLEIYEKYRALSKKFSNLMLVGRLAEYKYFNMDSAVASALNKAATLRERKAC